MLNFALVGCGRIAKRHAHILTSPSFKESRLVAVCDIDVEAAKTLGRENNVPYFLDMHEMLLRLNSTIDVLVVLTPSGLHAKHVIELSRYNKPIIVEKPMALTVEDADAMIEACKINQVPLFVVKQNRFNLPVVKLAQAIREGKFGKLVMGTVRVRWCRTQEYYDLAEWRGTIAYDRGVFANQASHHIDLLQWLIGDFESVVAKSRTALVNIESEDTGLAIINFKNGALGLVEATTAARPSNIEGSISILGENGMVEIGGLAVNEMKIWKFKNEDYDEGQLITKYSSNPPDVYGFGHQSYYHHIIDCLLNGKKAMIDGAEGRRSVELISMMYDSIEYSKEIIKQELDTAPVKSCHLEAI